MSEPDTPSATSAGRSGDTIADDIAVADASGILFVAERYRVAAAALTSEARAVLQRLDVLANLIMFDFHLLDESNEVQPVCALRENSEKNIPAFIVSGDTSKVIDQGVRSPIARSWVVPLILIACWI